MKYLVLKIEYDGTAYSGWQSQKNALSVQSVLQNTSEQIFSKKLSIIGSGRTDAGVHARGQIAHTVLDFHPKISESQIVKAFNHYLPDDIKMSNARIFELPFHSVRDAVRREYSYSIHTINAPLLRHFSTFVKFKINEEKLIKSAELFAGEYDFTTFSKLNKDTESYICKVELCEWLKLAEGQYKMRIASNRFVYGMVRALAGVMLDIAKSKRDLNEVKESLLKTDRNLASPLAPAKGLVLEKVDYPEIFKLDDF